MSAYDLMRKWKIHFEGKADEDGEEFLKRVQEGRHLVGINDEELFSCLPFFLDGVALHWFRNQSQKPKFYIFLNKVITVFH